MRFSNCCDSKSQYSGVVFIEKTTCMMLPARANELEELH
jgi:hypothetical protein